MSIIELVEEHDGLADASKKEMGEGRMRAVRWMVGVVVQGVNGDSTPPRLLMLRHRHSARLSEHARRSVRRSFPHNKQRPDLSLEPITQH